MYCGYRRFFYLKIQKKYKTFFNVKNLQYTLVWREKKRMSLPPENKFFGNTIPFCSIVDVLLVICFTFITKKEKIIFVNERMNEWNIYSCGVSLLSMILFHSIKRINQNWIIFFYKIMWTYQYFLSQSFHLFYSHWLLLKMFQQQYLQPKETWLLLLISFPKWYENNVLYFKSKRTHIMIVTNKWNKKLCTCDRLDQACCDFVANKPLATFIISYKQNNSFKTTIKHLCWRWQAPSQTDTILRCKNSVKSKPELT